MTNRATARTSSQANTILNYLAPLPPATAAPVLFLTVGLPASGKSTFARKLAPRIDAVILDSDALRRLLFPSPTHARAESAALFAAIYEATEHLLRGGVSVIIDATSLRAVDREPAQRIAQEAGARFLVAHFVANEAETRRRLEARSTGLDPADRSTADLAVYERMTTTEEPVLGQHWQIDTSDAVATAAALNEIVETCIKVPAATGKDGR